MRGNIRKHVFYVAQAAASTRPVSLLDQLRQLGGIATLQRRKQREQGQHDEQGPPSLTIDEAAELVPCPTNIISRDMQLEIYV